MVFGERDVQSQNRRRASAFGGRNLQGNLKVHAYIMLDYPGYINSQNINIGAPSNHPLDLLQIRTVRFGHIKGVADAER